MPTDSRMLFSTMEGRSGEAAGLSVTEAKGKPMEVYSDCGAADAVGSKLVTSLYAKLPNTEVSSDDS
jgi:hypothetical protein